MKRGHRIATASEALALMRAAGLEPQEPYPGSSDLPWSSRCATCGASRKTSLSAARRGVRCDHAPLIHGAEAVEKELRAAGYEPLEPYPGRVGKAWRARCVECGRECRPRVAGVRSGRRCKHKQRRPGQAAKNPGRKRTPPDIAAGELRAAGYEPLEPYPGYTDLPWKARCVTCQATRTIRLNAVRRGLRCKHNPRSVTAQQALAEMRAAGYEPQETFPGAADLAWTSHCVTCLATRRPSLSSIRQGKRCGHNALAIPKDVAEAELRAAGYEPLAPYPGKVGDAWRARCVECGGARRPSLARVREGHRCKHNDIGSGWVV